MEYVLDHYNYKNIASTKKKLSIPIETKNYFICLYEETPLFS